MIDHIFLYKGALLGMLKCTVAHILHKISIIKIRNNSIVILPLMQNNFTSSNLLTSKRIEVTQVKIIRIKYTLMKIEIIGDTPTNLYKAWTKKTKVRLSIILEMYYESLKVAKSKMYLLI